MKPNMNMIKNNACYLCKAKREDWRWQNGIEKEQWILGNLLIAGDRYYIVKCKINDLSNELYLDTAIEVDKNTICRCTGLSDKNESLIFENDIVKIGTYEYLIWWNREGQEMTAVPIKGICFNGTDYYNGCNPKFTYHDFICMMQDPYGDFIDEIEVVGSIIDNPKLLDIKEKSYNVDNNLDEIDL